jgi:hypothetical protein
LEKLPDEQEKDAAKKASLVLSEPHGKSVLLGYQSFPDILRMHDASDEATFLSIFFCLR